MPTANTEEDFWALVTMTPSCWDWSGYVSETGYGRFTFRGKDYQAHRLALIFTEGHDPDGLVALHDCDNRACVNPFHLRFATQAENIKDMWEKGRGCCGESVHNSKLTDDDVREIRRRYKKRIYGAPRLAEEFGVSRTTIWKIVNGKKWTHVD